MGIEVQAQTCQPTPGQQLTFKFQNQLQTFVAGLGHFFLTYGPTTNHWIETLSIALEANQNGNDVDVTVAATMMDSTGHMLDAGASYITVVCIAQTGAADPNTFLLNRSGVTPTLSQQVPLPGTGSDCSVLETCLSGLHFGYNGTNRAYEGATASAGINAQANEAEGTLTATASIWDSNGHQASTVAIDAGVIASVDQPPGFMVQPVTQARTSVLVPPLSFPSSGRPGRRADPELQRAVPLRGARRAVAQGGVPESHRQRRRSSRLGPCDAATTDGEGHYSANWESSVNLLVVAVPRPSA